MIPARAYRYSLKKGMEGHDVWALQLYLGVTDDGVFGDATEAAVKTFQKGERLTVDGIAGLITQRALIVKVGGPYTTEFKLPKYLLSSLVDGESGWALGCVNWSVPGGVDCGAIQDRVTWAGGPGGVPESRWREAFGPESLRKTAGEQRARKDKFYAGRAKSKGGTGKYPGVTTHQSAWELAILYHNWPAGATHLLKGEPLSEEPAKWVLDIGVRGVESPADWARFYIGRMTTLVTNWTA